MKIDHLGPLRPSAALKPAARASSGSSFADVLDDERRRLAKAAYAQLLGDIERQGQKLAHTRSARDLLAYKALIQRFVREVVDRALAFEARHGQDRRRRPRVYKLLRVLDEKLLELSQAVLAKETPRVELLARIGEIHGLLVNLCV
ncbi:YaaR family protein [Calditerricola satsumensis]|uniref:DUF327 family protein n=1 Tax=Calditerricola satsumensis TaxID=373054 RepID=A0A8J3B8X8_9BACI|nr:YaaR family protein [Calditerricola satsumensis]GGK02929.1 hypothetical protein GCM10007043_16190 [Calditerricola satsumensis]